MENLVDHNLFKGVYKGRKVLVTGHTGFKGSWLSYLLQLMGADVCGYSLEAPSQPAHIDLLKFPIKSVIGDIRDYKKLESVFTEFQPEIVFHLAAQPLVRFSYQDPITTYDTNVTGSLKVYEACRKCKSVNSIVTITTDKVYDNKEWIWAYRENDMLGGKDPYSASKAAMEIMTRSYIHSFFNKDNLAEHNTLIATARAGNVIGGGDWAEDRLIPDIMRATANNKEVEIRNPKAIRPWQHVLDPLFGYLLLGQKLLERQTSFADEFNFGPNLNEESSVMDLVNESLNQWKDIKFKVNTSKNLLHEAQLLKLDSTKAINSLGWKPMLSTKEALALTIRWYRDFYSEKKVNTLSDIMSYLSKL